MALSSESLLTAILNDEVLSKIRMGLLRERGCPLTNQEIQEAIEREWLPVGRFALEISLKL